jgi:hypothetical protein
MGGGGRDFIFMLRPALAMAALAVRTTQPSSRNQRLVGHLAPQPAKMGRIAFLLWRAHLQATTASTIPGVRAWLVQLIA